MSEILPTIKVKHKKYGIEMLINEVDFDENVHESLEKEKKQSSENKFEIVKRDGGFVIVDKTGKPYDETVYSTKADARLSLSLIQGE